MGIKGEFNIDVKTHFGWDKPITQIIKDSTGGDALQLFLANESRRLMDPYVPSSQKGMLRRNVRVYVENGKGIVHYMSPYARYIYMGNVMVSAHPGVRRSSKVVKQPKKKLEYITAFHPLATAEWDKAMLAARKEDLVAAGQRFLNSRGK